MPQFFLRREMMVIPYLLYDRTPDVELLSGIAVLYGRIFNGSPGEFLGEMNEKQKLLYNITLDE